MALNVWNTTVVKNHKHYAYVDQAGNGKTTVDNNHSHTVKNWTVLITNNHQHLLIRR